MTERHREREGRGFTVRETNVRGEGRWAGRREGHEAGERSECRERERKRERDGK